MPAVLRNPSIMAKAEAFLYLVWAVGIHFCMDLIKVCDTWPAGRLRVTGSQIKDNVFHPDGIQFVIVEGVFGPSSGEPDIPF